MALSVTPWGRALAHSPYRSWDVFRKQNLQVLTSHADYTGVARATRMAKALYAVDELCGMVTACALVRPSRSVNDLEVSSVKKKMKDKAFARGVNRDDVVRGAAELGVEMDAHIAMVIAAMRDRAALLGLAGAAG